MKQPIPVTDPDYTTEYSNPDAEKNAPKPPYLKYVVFAGIAIIALVMIISYIRSV